MDRRSALCTLCNGAVDTDDAAEWLDWWAHHYATCPARGAEFVQRDGSIPERFDR